MMQALNKLLNVRPGEWTRLLLLSAVIFVVNIGVSWGTTVAYAAFLKQTGLQAGLETLIWVLLLSSLLAVPVLSVYAVFVDRMDANRLFSIIVMAEAAVIVISLGLLLAGMPIVAFPLLYVLVFAIASAFNPQFFTYVNEVYDIQTAKRALPLILAAGRIGAALAGFTQQYVTGWLGTQGTIWVWLACDAVVIAIILSIPAVLKRSQKSAAPASKAPEAESKEKASYLRSLSEGLSFTLQSNFLRWMAAGTLLLTAVMTLLEYHVNQILSPAFATSADFAGFLGLINGISNLVALVILLFGLSRVTKAWGVANTSLIFPAGNLLINTWMLAFPNLWSASFGNLNRRGLRFSLQLSLEAQLYNAVPHRIKGRARAFVGGLVAPIGAIVGVLLLLVGRWNNWPMLYVVPGVILGLSLLYLGISLVIRNQYTRALVKMLEEEDYTFLLNEEASEQVVVDPAALQRLKKLLEESSSHEMRVFMTQLIAQVGGAESLSLIIPVIKTTEEARTRAAMLNVVAAAGLGGEKIRELYGELLSDSDGRVRQAAAAGLEQLLGAKNAWFQEVLLGMVNDPDGQVALYALQVLANSGELARQETAVQKVQQFLQSNSLEDKKIVLGVLGKLPPDQAVEALLPFLQDSNDLLRLEAVLQLEALAQGVPDQLGAVILAGIRPLAADPVARIRQVALDMLRKANQPEDAPTLIAALADKNPTVRAAVADMLVGTGKDTLPGVQAALQSPDPQMKKMAAVVLSRVQPRSFAPLIENEINESLRKAYQNIGRMQALRGVGQYPSIQLLLSALDENNRELIDDTLYMLSAVHPQEAIAVIRGSLNSDLASTRNLALEALESLTSRRSASLIAALFDPSQTPEQLIQLGQESWPVEKGDLAQVFTQLLDQRESRTLALLAVHALRDVALGQPRPKRLAGRGTRLLQLLEEAPAAPQPEPAPDMFPKLKVVLESLQNSPEDALRQVAQETLQKLGVPEPDPLAVLDAPGSGQPLSTVDRMALMKELPFFRNFPVSQLETLAEVCEEKAFAKGECVYPKGAAGGILYIVISGEVGIEQEKQGRKVLLANHKKASCFGEGTFFDNSAQTTTAVAVADSRLLELQRAPIIQLTTQDPALALELINVLSQRIRETDDRLADVARSRPRELHKLYDQFTE